MGCKSLKNITTKRLGAGRIYTPADFQSTKHGAPHAALSSIYDDQKHPILSEIALLNFY